VYVYPGGYETTTMQGITAGVPYAGARGALNEDLGVSNTYASGFDVQNVTSFGVNPSWMGSAGVTPALLNQKINALVWKEQVWGVPWGIFWHLNELTQTDPTGGTEISNLIQDFKASGATIQTNTSLVNWLMTGTLETGTDGNFYYKSPAASAYSANGGVDFRPTVNSPVVDAGENLGATYEIDLNGLNQNNFGTGWEIGAHAFAGYSNYGGNPPGSHFAIGGVGQPVDTLFGFTETGTSAGNFPTVSYGMQRLWDSPPLQWPSLETAANTFTFTNLDAMLAQDYSNGVGEVLYTLARTPPWITSQPTDTTCNYQLPATGGGNGECFPPSDLNSDGSGTNATWKAWITAIAQHANGQDGNPTYLTNHAHIRYWEIWNEPDTAAFWSGSIAQLARLTEDANCIITGRGLIHQSGNGTGTPCTATAIDLTAKIVMASGHANTASVLTYAQNELYCNNTAGIPSYELPCPNPANAIATAVDVINYHMKPGNSTGNNCPAPIPCTPETAMAMYVSSVQAYLLPAELAKPFWDGEMSYATTGFTNAYTDSDMQASFMPRMYLTMWSLGISGSAFYTWDYLETETAPEVLTAYQQTYDWLVGSVLATPCAASGTVYLCGIVKAGIPYGIIWDTAQSCSGGVCTTGNQTVSTQWGHYQDMTTASAPAGITGHSVAVGIKPVVLSE
jgi:hypothetical protein